MARRRVRTQAENEVPNVSELKAGWIEAGATVAQAAWLIGEGEDGLSDAVLAEREYMWRQEHPDYVPDEIPLPPENTAHE